MPQPDNRREQGAVTQTTQQQVAPKGQMAPSISPVSGGAAAAAPVLQIGQQAQIRQTGAELYQALAGTLQGVAQGLQNYEKMYQLQSEKDYADFETDYAQQVERTHNDPKLMKLWLDNNTYKPNRVTAKRYHSLRADIVGKDYLSHQNDEWIEISKKLGQMPLPQAMEWANSNIGQYDEGSPVYANLQGFIVEGSGKLAASQRSLATGQLSMEMKQDSLGFIQRLHGAGFFDLSSLEMNTIMQARSLGLVQEASKPDGTSVLLYNGQEFTPHTVPYGLMAELHDQIGQIAALDPDRVSAAMEGNKFNETVLRAGSTAGQALTTDVKRATAGFIYGASANSDGTWKAIIEGQIPATTPNRGSAIGSVISDALSQLKNNPEMNEGERWARMLNMQGWFDYEANSSFYDNLGLHSQDAVDAFYRKERDSIEVSLRESGQKLSAQGADTQDNLFGSATSTAQITQLSRQIFNNQIVPYLATIATEDHPVMITGFAMVPTGPMGISFPVPKSINLKDYDAEMQEGFIPGAITFVDTTMSGQVSFAYNWREGDLPEGVNSEGVFVGTANTDKIPKEVQDRLATMAVSMREARAAEDLMMGKPIDSRELAITGMDRIISSSPEQGIALLARNAGKGNELLSEESATALAEYFTPERLATLDQPTRKALSEAYNNSDVFKNAIDSSSGNENVAHLRDTMYRFGHLLDSPAQITRLTSTLRTKFPTRLQAATQEITELPVEGLIAAYALLETDEGKANGGLRGAALTGYAAQYERYSGGQSLVEDLQSSDSEVQQSALNFVRTSSRDSATMGNLIAGAFLSQEEMVDALATGRYPNQSLATFDPNNLAAPGRVSMTAETQVFADFALNVLKESKGDIAATAELLNVPTFIIQGLADGTELNPTTVRNAFSYLTAPGFISVRPRGAGGVSAGKTENGSYYSEAEYSVGFSLDRLPSDLSEQLRSRLEVYFNGPANVTFTRRLYNSTQGNGVPPTTKTGNQIKQDLDKAEAAAIAHAYVSGGTMGVVSQEIKMAVYKWWNGVNSWFDRRSPETEEISRRADEGISNVARGTGLLVP